MKNKEHLKGLDSLRAIAALIVVWSHIEFIKGLKNIPQNNFAEPIQNNFVAPIIEQPIAQNSTNPVNSTNSISNESSKTIIELIEQVAALHKAGILTDNEFNTKKSELLSRL